MGGVGFVGMELIDQNLALRINLYFVGKMVEKVRLEREIMMREVDSS